MSEAARRKFRREGEERRRQDLIEATLDCVAEKGLKGATVRAIEPSVVHRIEDAESFLQLRPEIVFHVARILARRLIDATTYLADIKHQFADRTDHLGMVDEVLEALVNQQQSAAPAGSALKSDPRL